MLFEVYKCVQLNRCSVVCGCVLQRGQGDWTDVSELYAVSGLGRVRVGRIRGLDW